MENKPIAKRSKKYYLRKFKVIKIYNKKTNFNHSSASHQIK